MKIVLAFDSYKGNVSAVEACEAAAVGLMRLSPVPGVVHCPLSDGGEGFAEALNIASGGTVCTLAVTGPCFAPVQARVVYLDGGRTAVIEAGQACGLGLRPVHCCAPMRKTTRVVGEMLAAAVSAGATKLLIGLGGSATNDAGMGMLTALGWQFLDAAGLAVAPTGAGLADVATIVPGQTLEGIAVIAACDVDNPLCGPRGAAYVYAPQKGATPDEVEALDRGLAQVSAIWAGQSGHDFAMTPGAGAAGGLGFALLAMLGARFMPGAAVAINACGLEQQLAGATLCLTGEGRTDGQTAFGKLPAAVAACCARVGVPCVCLSGALGDCWRGLYAGGMTSVLSISQGPQSLREAISHTRSALADAAEAIGRLMSQCEFVE